jgi:hypothetical protein
MFHPKSKELTEAYYIKRQSGNIRDSEGLQETLLEGNGKTEV